MRLANPKSLERMCLGFAVGYVISIAINIYFRNWWEAVSSLAYAGNWSFAWYASRYQRKAHERTMEMFQRPSEFLNVKDPL